MVETTMIEEEVRMEMTIGDVPTEIALRVQLLVDVVEVTVGVRHLDEQGMKKEEATETVEEIAVIAVEVMTVNAVLAHEMAGIEKEKYEEILKPICSTHVVKNIQEVRPKKALLKCKNVTALLKIYYRAV